MKKHTKILLTLLLLVALTLVIAACDGGEPTEEPVVDIGEEPTEAVEPTDEEHPNVPMSDLDVIPVITTANDVVGVGSYVAAEPYAIPAGDDPAEEPVEAMVMPYAIYPDMEVEDIEEFDYEAQSYKIEVEGFTFEWALEAPDGSSAALLEDYLGLFLADVAGEYDLTLTATDEAGNSGTTTWTVTVATYVGAEACAGCHDPKIESWAETGHSDILVRGLDGTLSSHYGGNCIHCHTAGFNNRPEAVNGGFDDRASDAGWEFPGVFEEGGYGVFVTDYPEVAALANIQCEACHGPASAHLTGDVQNPGPIGSSLDYGNCAQCHAEMTHHVYPMQWELSGHAEANSRAFWYPIGEGHEDCTPCHNGAGFIDYTNGVPVEERRTPYQVITCSVCHDPHTFGSEDSHQMRIAGTVTLPDGTEVEAGNSATCMTCHNQNGSADTSVSAAVGGGHFETPHYSAASELLNGTGGYTWGETLPTSGMHWKMLENGCISCHMADTPGMDDMGTPDDSSDDTPLPGLNSVGEHTFAMTSPVDGTENVAACVECHSDMTTFAMTASEDYDGDGAVETNEEEVEGLIETLKAALEANGLVFLGRYPYFEYPPTADEALYGATWNYQLLTHNNNPAHNMKYLVALAQLSIEKLAGE